MGYDSLSYTHTQFHSLSHTHTQFHTHFLTFTHSFSFFLSSFLYDNVSFTLACKMYPLLITTWRVFEVTENRAIHEMERSGATPYPRYFNNCINCASVINPSHHGNEIYREDIDEHFSLT
jgi:hypothetical protein